MANIFQRVARPRIPSSVFDLSHRVKMSGKFGTLYPIYVDEVIPGDRFRVRTDVFMRCAPMIAPVMHEVSVFVHHFFVPNRLIWSNWEDFITGGTDGTLAPVMPYTVVSGNIANNVVLAKGTLWDYLGLPPSNVARASPIPGQDTFGVSVLPFRAYQLIFNEYYRDQTLTPEVDILKDQDGINFHALGSPEAELFQLRNRAWEKDYFTSALPWAQRGAEVTLPIGGEVNVQARYSAPGLIASNALWRPVDAPVLSESFTQNSPIVTGTPSTGFPFTPAVVTNSGQARHVAYDPQGTLYADLATASSVTVNELRRTTRLQMWLERNARAGARYVEQILSHFGVVSPDARLQRPEYLGGSRFPIVISEVLQTSETTGTTPSDTSPQGGMAGHGIAAGRGNGFTRRFSEHGYIMSILSVLPRTAYQDGIPRMFLKRDKFDFAYPEFANLGEQAIYKAEISFDPTQDMSLDRNIGTFGYTPRYAEYKYHPSRVAGDMRDTLDFWHLGRKFNTSSDIPLNDAFVRSNEAADGMRRIFAVQDGTDYLWFEIAHSITARRPLPYFGTPRL